MTAQTILSNARIRGQVYMVSDNGKTNVGQVLKASKDRILVTFISGQQLLNREFRLVGYEYVNTIWKQRLGEK